MAEPEPDEVISDYLGALPLGHIDALPPDDELVEEDLELEEAIERARRAGGVELELGIGFVPVTRRRRS